MKVGETVMVTTKCQSDRCENGWVTIGGDFPIPSYVKPCESCGGTGKKRYTETEIQDRLEEYQEMMDYYKEEILKLEKLLYE